MKILEMSLVRGGLAYQALHGQQLYGNPQSGERVMQAACQLRQRQLGDIHTA